MTEPSPELSPELSPLAEIERLALDEANDQDLDISGETADSQLRAIVVQLIENWRSDFRRGRRQVDLPDPATLCERAMRNLTGYGPLESLLAEEDVWEVMVNSPDDALVDAWGRRVSEDEIGPYWRRLVEANEDRLVEPTNPDLILPGQQFVLPPVPADPRRSESR